ncbi:unnamed protein product, partial [Rotaria socialis]
PSTQTAPCPMPRVRKPQYKIDVDMLPSGIILPPSPPTRRQQQITHKARIKENNFKMFSFSLYNMDTKN